MVAVTPQPSWRPLVSGDYGDHRFVVALASDKGALRFSFAAPGDQSDPDAWAHSAVPLQLLLEKAYAAFLARQTPDAPPAP